MSLTIEQFSVKRRWKLGEWVCDARDPARYGQIVKRGGQQWTSRDKLPWVRWSGKLDAEPVAWEHLELRRGPATHGEQEQR